MLKMIKAVLFDMDGVLIDSHDAWFDVFNATLLNFGFKDVSVEEFDKYAWGINFAKTAANYFPGRSIEEIREYFYKIFDKFIAKVKKIRNVDQILEYLKNKNLRLVVVSNGQSNLVKKLLDGVDINKYFNLIVGGERVKDGKPNPEIILIACNELKLKPSETILIGDTIYDKQAAQAAGCGFIGYKMKYGVNDLIEIKKVMQMSIKKIIPCLDMKDGRVVKGVKFVNIKDAGDPVEFAKEYIRQGADELVLLDISASLEKRKTMIDVVKKVAAVTTIPFTVGGGMRTIEDIKDVLDAGADKVSINTAAVENPGLIKEATKKFGKKIVVAIDVQKNSKMKSGYEVLIYGGEKPTGKDAVEWAKEAASLGAIAILPTSKDRDGTKDGYDLEITRKIKEAVNVPVIASGGVGNLKHILDGLTKGKADAALAASIFHFKEYTVKDIKDYLKKEGVEVR